MCVYVCVGRGRGNGYEDFGEIIEELAVSRIPTNAYNSNKRRIVAGLQTSREMAHLLHKKRNLECG